MIALATVGESTGPRMAEMNLPSAEAFFMLSASMLAERLWTFFSSWQKQIDSRKDRRSACEIAHI